MLTMPSKVTSSGKALLTGAAWEGLRSYRRRSWRISVGIMLLHHIVLVVDIVWAVLLLLMHLERLLHSGRGRISWCHVVHEAGCRISRVLRVMG